MTSSRTEREPGHETIGASAAAAHVCFHWKNKTTYFYDFCPQTAHILKHSCQAYILSNNQHISLPSSE